ncbi:ABC transporter substrate-binding protein [Candidatus Woesearchaeota archaeon]|nr:ABC transporter substrate-binding protein [Candidatus Woesearchaeota archaeon]
MKKTVQVLLVFIAIILVSCQVQVQPEQPASRPSAPAPAADTSPIKIGVMYPLSGDAAAYGLPIQKATQIAVDEINAKRGIKGRQIQLIYEDSKCNPKDGNAAAQKLVNIDNVKVIIGGVCSGETLGAAPITEAGKVILISPSATSPDVTNAGDYVFRVAPSDAYAGVVASDYAFKDLKAKKAAVISESTDYAQGLRKVFKENFAKLGGTIVADEVYNPEDTDFRTQVTKVKAANPDVIYVLPQPPQKGILLVKQIKEAGIKTQLLTAEVLIGRNVVKENAVNFEGMIGIEQKFDDKAPKAAALLAKYKQATEEDAPFPGYMGGAYDVVYLLSDAIGKHGMDTEKIKSYLYAVKGYEGAVGKLTIDQNGDPIMDYSIKQAKGGELVTLR